MTSDAKPGAAKVAIRAFEPGDAGYVAYLHGTLYKRIYGFEGSFEYYVLKGLSEFLHDPRGGNLWVARLNGETVGSVAIVRMDGETAQLRWFIVAEGCQGKGIGDELLKTALGFCKAQGYRRVFLWTVDILGAARHLYGKHGFTLSEEKPNTEWTDSPILEERWDLEL